MMRSAVTLALLPLYAVGVATRVLVYAAGLAWRQWRLQQDAKGVAAVFRADLACERALAAERARTAADERRRLEVN